MRANIRRDVLVQRPTTIQALRTAADIADTGARPAQLAHDRAASHVRRHASDDQRTSVTCHRQRRAHRVDDDGQHGAHPKRSGTRTTGVRQTAEDADAEVQDVEDADEL